MQSGANCWRTEVDPRRTGGGWPGGAYLENIVLNDLLAWRDASAERIDLHYWRTVTGDEIDFVIESGGRGCCSTRGKLSNGSPRTSWPPPGGECSEGQHAAAESAQDLYALVPSPYRDPGLRGNPHAPREQSPSHDNPALTAGFSWCMLGGMIDRAIDRKLVQTALKRSRIVALLGPRQCGKTTLAREFLSTDSLNYFDLEDPSSLARLDEPDTALRPLKGLVVVDEIQRRPDLFPLLRVLADRRPLPARFLILGSAAPELLRQSSETLAGRIETVALEGFRLADLGAARLERHWLRGGFPLSTTARTETDSATWRRQFLQTFLERDIPQLGVRIPSVALRRFWSMLAHYHGQTWNAAELGRALAVNESTVRRYLDLMTGVFMVRQLPPWHENLGKRQVKAPKVYVRDSGLLHALLGISRQKDLEHHPKVGASWEGYAIEEILKALRPDEAYYWATHQGAELDLLLFKDGRRIGIECKRTDAPTLSPSMRIALTDLKLDTLLVAYPGTKRYSLADEVEVVPLPELVGAR